MLMSDAQVRFLGFWTFFAVLVASAAHVLAAYFSN